MVYQYMKLVSEKGIQAWIFDEVHERKGRGEEGRGEGGRGEGERGDGTNVIL